MKKGLILTLLCLVWVTACNDGDGGNPPEPQTYSFVGTWYEVGSTDDIGVKVIFTETNMFAFSYTKDHINPSYPFWGDSIQNDTLWWYYDDVTYNILCKDTIQLNLPIDTLNGTGKDIHYSRLTMGCPFGKNITNYTFYGKDTLFLRYFMYGNTQGGREFDMHSILLWRKYVEE